MGGIKEVVRNQSSVREYGCVKDDVPEFLNNSEDVSWHGKA
jgi:hypothetical protein